MRPRAYYEAARDVHIHQHRGSLQSKLSKARTRTPVGTSGFDSAGSVGTTIVEVGFDVLTEAAVWGEATGSAVFRERAEDAGLSAGSMLVSGCWRDKRRTTDNSRLGDPAATSASSLNTDLPRGLGHPPNHHCQQVPLTLLLSFTLSRSLLQTSSSPLLYPRRPRLSRVSGGFSTFPPNTHPTTSLHLPLAVIMAPATTLVDQAGLSSQSFSFQTAELIEVLEDLSTCVTTRYRAPLPPPHPSTSPCSSTRPRTPSTL